MILGVTASSIYKGSVVSEPDFLTDGSTKIWLDYTQNVTTSGTLVTTWGDRSGNGNDLTSVAGKEPTLQSNGVYFDGVKGFLRIESANFTIAQLFTVHLILDVESILQYDYLFAGDNTNTRCLITLADGSKIQTVLGGTARETVINPPASSGSTIVLSVVSNGSASKVFINGVQQGVDFNAGVTNLEGFVIGAEADVRVGEFRYKEVILRNVADTPAQVATIYNYFTSKHI